MDRMLSEEQFVCFNVRDFLNPEETSGVSDHRKDADEFCG